MKQKMPLLFLLVLWIAILGLTAQEKQQTAEAVKFDLFSTAGRIKIDGSQDIGLTRSNRTFFLKVGYALGL